MAKIRLCEISLLRGKLWRNFSHIQGANVGIKSWHFTNQCFVTVSDTVWQQEHQKRSS